MIKLLNENEIQKYKKEILEVYCRVFNFNEETGDFLITRIDESIKNKLNTKVFAAFNSNKLIGFLFGFDFKKDNWWAKQISEFLPNRNFDWFENTFELNELAVLKEYRRNGYGKLLIKNLIEKCNKNRILLSTSKENNDGVINFYYNLGFKDLINPFEYKNFDYPTSIIMCYENE